jgi:hypothetical protein
MRYIQCCGSGSAWICIDLALVDSNLCWECGFGSRSKEIDQYLLINLSKIYVSTYFLTYYLHKVYFSLKISTVNDEKV